MILKKKLQTFLKIIKLKNSILLNKKLMLPLKKINQKIIFKTPHQIQKKIQYQITNLNNQTKL